MLQLISSAGDQTIDLQDGRALVVGRAVTSDVRVYDPTVSRRHAQLTISDGNVEVQDFGSSNGTYVNGERVSEGVAKPGDVITFGKVAYHLQTAKPPPPPPPRGPTAHMPPDATIVRAMPVAESGGVPALLDDAKSSSTSLLSTPVERRQKKLSLLLEISKELSRQQGLDRLLQKVADFTFQIMNVDRVSILMHDDETGELVPR